jgi:hypothetical protein
VAFKNLTPHAVVELIQALSPRFIGRDHDTLLAFADVIVNAAYELAWANDQPAWTFIQSLQTNAGASYVLTDDGTSIQDRINGLVKISTLASNTTGKGSDMVGFVDPYTVPFLQTTSHILQGLPVSLHRFLNPIKLSQIRDFTSTFDCTSGINAALADPKVRALKVPFGLYNYAGNLNRSTTGIAIAGDGSAATIFRAQGAGGIVFDGGNSSSYSNRLPKLDLGGISFEAAVNNAGTAIRMMYTGGSGQAPLGSRFSDVLICSSSETGFVGGPTFNKGIYGTNVRDIKMQGIAIGGNPGSVGHPINPLMTHGMHFDGNDDPVEIWIDDYYAYYLQCGLEVNGQYEGIYVNRMSTVAIFDGIKWVSPSPNPTFQLFNSYLGTQRLGCLLDMISYYQIANVEFNPTAPVPQANYVGVKLDRSAVPGVSNQTNMGTMENCSIIGVGYSSISAYTETGIWVVSGNTSDFLNNKIWDMDVGFKADNSPLNTELKVRNSYRNCTVNESISASTRRAIGGDVYIRTSKTGDLTFATNAAAKVVFTEVEDTSNDYYNPSSGDFTLPAGTYNIHGALKFVTGITTADVCQVDIKVQGTTAFTNIAPGAAGYCQLPVSGQISVNAGDVVTVYVTVSGTAGSRTLQGVPTQCYLNVEAAFRA